jgi:hypothetical protein
MLGLRAAMRFSLSLAVVFYGLALASAAQTSLQPESEETALRGTVLNSVTHEAVGRALVYSADNRFATLTDGRGRFEFSFSSNRTERKTASTAPRAMPAVGNNRPSMLMARKPGFITPQGAENAVLMPGQTEVTLYLVPEGLIVGHVTLPGSDGSDKVQVELFRRQVQDGRAHWASVNTVTTRSDGEFRFAELVPGTYKVLTHELLDRDPLTFDPRGQLYGYPPVYFPAANNFASATAIQLSAGMTFQANFSPIRREYYPVEIAVANIAEGTGLNVFVSPGEKGPGFSLGYNPQEQRIEGLLPDGTYAVEVWSFGPTGGSGLANITVSGGPVRGQTMVVVPNGGIPVKVTQELTQAENGNSPGGLFVSGAGSVVTRRGRPVTVYLESADEYGQGRSASVRPPSGPDDDSIFLENVQPGRYWVRVDASRGYAASVRSGGTDLLHHPLVVPLGGSPPPIEVTLRDDAAQIEGTIENSSTGATARSESEGPVHVYLVPLPESTGHFREIWVSPDGHFSSAGIPPGDYRVLAFARKQPELEYRNDQAMRTYDSKGQVIHLLPDQKERLRLHTIAESD